MSVADEWKWEWMNASVIYAYVRVCKTLDWYDSGVSLGGRWSRSRGVKELTDWPKSRLKWTKGPPAQDPGYEVVYLTQRRAPDVTIFLLELPISKCFELSIKKIISFFLIFHRLFICFYAYYLLKKPETEWQTNQPSDKWLDQWI